MNRLQRRLVTRHVGFTMLELLAVVAVVAMLLALLLPAVQGAREAARAAYCQSNLRSLGIAYLQYAESHGVLPPAETYAAGVMNSLAPVHQNYLHTALVLPLLGERNTYEHVNYELAAGGHENTTARLIVAHSFLCPSLPENLWENELKPFFGGPTAYVGNEGSGRWSSAGPDGVFPVGSPTRLRDITDGTSRTAMVSEWIPRANEQFPEAKLWELNTGLESREAFTHACMEVGRSITRFGGHQLGITWLGGAGSRAVYNHQLDPGQNSCLGIHLERRTSIPLQHCAYTARSLHNRFVHLLLCDGSVQRIGYGIDREIWRAMGSRNGDDGL